MNQKITKSLYEKIRDPIWRLSNLYKIVNKESELVTFRPNKVQQKINENQKPRKIILKARQFGVSTNEVLKMFDYVIWNKNVTACILAHENDAIKKLFRIVRRAYKYLHPDLQPDIDRGGGSRYEMYFPGLNSLIYCDLESRGDTINWLHVSECAFMEQERLLSTLQAVPLKGRVTIETTPNGMGNHFYEMWVDEGNNYDKLFFPWFFHDEYKIKYGSNFLNYSEEELALIEDAKRRYNITISRSQLRFRRFKKEELKKIFFQEYPENDIDCFLASGEAVMDLKIVKDLMDKVKKPIIKNEELEIYHNSESRFTYIVSADTAEGIGNDYSVATVICVDTLEEVAFLRGHFSPSVFAEKLVNLCQKYSRGVKFPLLVVERNNHGHAVLLKLKEILRYPNIYQYEDERDGWKTDLVSRPIMMNAFMESVQNRTVKINSIITLKECLTLIDKNKKIQAESGKHDDAVMATAIGIQVCIKQKTEIDIYSNLADKIRI